MVLVTFRTVQNKIHKIELDPEMTIKDAKERFLQEIGGGNAAAIKMIFKAKLLTDDIKISSLNLGEKDFIVVHAPKPAAPKPAAPAQPPAQTSTPAQPAEQPSTQPLPAQPPSGGLPDVQPLPNVQQPTPTPPGQGGFPGAFPGGAPSAGGNAGGIPEGPEFQEGITQLMELGFGRTDAEAALRAAYGNVDRAAEYLFSGHIPETEEAQNQQNFERSVRLLAATMLMNPRALENVIELLEPNDPSFRTNPERALQIFGGLPQERFDLEGIRNRTLQPLDQQQFMQLQAQAANALAAQGVPGFQFPNTGGAPPPGPGPAPGQVPGFQPGPPPSGPGPAPGPAGPEALLARFTPEEQEAIRRLQQLGNFNLLDVIQYYEACEKNEEMTANLLFSNLQ